MVNRFDYKFNVVEDAKRTVVMDVNRKRPWPIGLWVRFFPMSYVTVPEQEPKLIVDEKPVLEIRKKVEKSDQTFRFDNTEIQKGMFKTEVWSTGFFGVWDSREGEETFGVV